jgi:hypothetical protein
MAPAELARYLTEHGYHPRSSKHGDAMCEFVLRDLNANCPTLSALASRGAIVYQTNYTVNEGTPSKWTIDLVLGPRKGGLDLEGAYIARDDPLEVWIAIDAKAIMTEHGKARRNRQRDLNSMAEILHRMDPTPIIGAYVAINMAAEFRSPLRKANTRHRNIERIVAETIPLMTEILQDEESGHPGLDAIGVTILDYSNAPGSQCRVIEAQPAPDRNRPLYYDNFIARLCEKFTARFGQ